MSSLLKSYSLMNSKNGISTINIAPGPFRQTEWKISKNLKNLKKFTYQKIGDPKEIGKFVEFVVKNNIKYISGSTVYFDGNLNKSFL